MTNRNGSSCTSQSRGSPLWSSACEHFFKSTFRRDFVEFAELVLKHDMKKYGQLKLLLISSPIGYRPSTRSVKEAKDFVQWIKRLINVESISFETFRKILKELTRRVRKKKKRIRATLLRAQRKKLSKAKLGSRDISKLSNFSTKVDQTYDIDLQNMTMSGFTPTLRCPDSRETTLHYALRSHISYEKIRAIVEAYPRALKIKDINGSYPVHLLRDPQIPFEICEFVYNQTRKFFGPHEIPFESMVLSNAPIVDMVLHSPIQINHDDNDFRCQDILTALRLKDPSRILVSMLNRSYRTLSSVRLVNCLFEAINVGHESSVISIFTVHLSGLTRNLDNALEYALSTLNKFNGM